MTRPPAWFLGLRVSEPAKLLHLVADAPAGIETTHQEDLHVTVSYLGPVSEASARSAFSLAREHPPVVIQATAGPPILLGPPARPWAICASIAEGRIALDAVLSTLGNPCRATAGLPPDGRERVPHCTLAAIDREARGDVRAGLVHWASALQTSGAALLLDTLGLFTSAEQGASTRYRCVDSARLR